MILIFFKNMKDKVSLFKIEVIDSLIDEIHFKRIS